jgi:hypothetical protein
MPLGAEGEISSKKNDSMVPPLESQGSDVMVQVHVNLWNIPLSHN